MDRLSALSFAAAVGLCGCDDSGDSKASPRSRVESIEAKTATAVDLEQFCEPWAEAADAKPFAYPALTGGAPNGGDRRWVNVWATWCKPCLEELPRINKWQGELGAKLELLAVDGDPEVVKSFATAHPEVQGTLEISDASALGPWLTSLGLSESSVLPLHFFVDRSDRLRCVRMAGLADRDHDAVAQILTRL